MIAVMIGATGLVGSHLIKLLLDDFEIKKIISVSRKSLNLANPKLSEVLISDLSELPKHADRLKGDVYFCTLGTTLKNAGSKENFRKIDYDAVLEFAKIAKHNKAQALLVVTATGADKNSLFFYNRIKGEVQQDLEKLGLRRVVIFKPALLVGKRTELRRAEKLAILGLTAISGLIPKTYQKKIMTSAKTLALQMRVEAKKTTPGFFCIEAKSIV